ncbi:GNAT family N-acetyltransferase [Clostridium botulinum]|uniref:GNAT family N-acetyltransferase n=1 Tax=Clostridium botulinum TaxID=1491 RepID=A0A0L9Y829_CLOBO|nr:GNAT family N-acetyltransferase [Clostridium botulinum]KAI3345046.1 GNAT family N-acetyltransferase [Clostridium botulinum]KOM87704.1 acetyltransferase [Clostridium botulinum]KOR63632.1 acetyltransferase [Clostridium botulinum]MCS6112267.1 GNAT family N-acetyltransferase [Clostridium botulinum]NFE13280.1 GNAT family N-acetyltransferase [Clostridium botulinum]
MIRLLQEKDIEIVCKIVNDNWKSVYAGYVNEQLLNDNGCFDRKKGLEMDLLSGRLSNYIYECNGQIVALLSIGDTIDSDKIGAFEVWRIYISEAYQNQGIGNQLINFAEEQAFNYGYKEIIIWAFKENWRAISFYKRHEYMKDKEEYLGEPYLTYGVRFNKRLNKTNLK